MRLFFGEKMGFSGFGFRQRPHSRRMPSRGRFARISPCATDAGVLLAVVFGLILKKFTCYGELSRHKIADSI